MSKECLKNKFAKILCKLRVDVLLRMINGNRLLIVTYHGIYDRFDKQSLPLFTHLHVDLFREHLKFFKKYYNVITLTELVTCIKEGKQWPEMAALITFDDGFRNNYEMVYPILKEFNLPATIFLTVDYIGTEKLLWFDELYLLLQQALNSLIDLELIGRCFGIPPSSRDISTQYPIYSKEFKKLSIEERTENILCLKNLLEFEDKTLVEHFKMLTWEQVLEMKSSGLVEFGVHTATHRIISEIPREDWGNEIIKPKNKMQEILNCEVVTFCFPNGIPELDFDSEHEKYLKENNYICAFSTEESLNSMGNNFFRLGRLPIGNDITSDKYFFRMNVSGVRNLLRKFRPS